MKLSNFGVLPSGRKRTEEKIMQHEFNGQTYKLGYALSGSLIAKEIFRIRLNN